MLTCQNIHIQRGYKVLLPNIGFSLFKGACLNIYGKNGSGKTSFLEYLSTLSGIKENTILVNKIDISNSIDEYRSITHYIGHKNPVDENLTVIDNLKFWAKIYNNEILIPSAIQCFGLDDFLEFEVRQLSQGWRRKLAMSLLLIKNANIWFMDEPFANLDDEGKKYLMDLFRIRCDQHGIVIFTSHTPVEEKFINYLNLADFK